MPPETLTPADLAAALAGRVIHDIAGQASGLLAALDLVADPAAGAFREEALALADQSARALVRRLALQRAILGGGDPISVEELASAAKELFGTSRAVLEVRTPAALDPLASRVLLGLLQLVQGAVVGGKVSGVIEPEPGSAKIVVISEGRVRLRDEERQGLGGEEPSSGQAHRWALAYWLWMLCRQNGGSLALDWSEGRLTIEARVPTSRAG